MLQKIGVLSFSEPFWIESIFDFPYRDDTFNAKVSALQKMLYSFKEGFGGLILYIDWR